MKNYLHIAQQTAIQAGKIALKMQNNLHHIQNKGIKDLVTEADLECDKVIRESLLNAFPNTSILSEELGAKGNENQDTWIVDPIDGTVNYSRGMPLWGISIALVRNNLPILGVIYLPALNELYTAISGEGAFCNDEKISVSNTNLLQEAIVSNGDFNVGNRTRSETISQWTEENIRIQRKSCMRVKSFGSAVVEASFVACGRLDAYSMTVSHPWDVAAAWILVEESGGNVSRLNGGVPILKSGMDILFSNQKLHSNWIQIFQKNASKFEL